MTDTRHLLPLNILVINQHNDLQILLSRLISSMGHCTAAISGNADVVHEAARQHPDLIVIEITAPEQPAIQITNRLQWNSLTRNIPLIVISDIPDLELELLHIYDFFCKPLDQSRFRACVDKIAHGNGQQVFSRTARLSPEDHLKFHDYLIEKCGLHFDGRNTRMLERGLESRMSALRISSYGAYYEYLSGSIDSRRELQKLLQHLLVTETYFFRLNAHFSALVKQVLPEAAGSAPGEKLRLWSAGCSTGEEPYTMAMTVMETFPDWRNRDIRILATDINKRSLKLARDGAYDSWKVRVTEKRYLEKYFKIAGSKYVVRDEVKSLVDFAEHNLQTGISSPPALPAESFDAIFCRNVMIYFNTRTNCKIVKGLTSHLKQGGYLFLGHSETLAGLSTKFDRQQFDGGFFYRKKTYDEPATPHVAAKTSEVAGAKISAKSERPLKGLKKSALPAGTGENIHAFYEMALARMNEKSPVKRESLFRKILAKRHDHIGAFLGEALISAHEGKLNEALTYCNMALLIDDLLPETYFLRGLVFELFGCTEESLREYEKAVLLKSDFVMPCFNMGKLCARTGKHKPGSRHLQNCRKILERLDPDTVIPYSGGIKCEAFLEQLLDEIKYLERHA